MYFLSFETSGKTFSLALSLDEKVLRYKNIKTALVLEDSFIPQVDKMLASAKVKFDQIDGFAIALGPGSFTSLRVGLSTVKAFAMGTGKPVVGIPSMDIIAHGIPNSLPPEGRAREGGVFDEICVLNDARRNKVYACFYDTKRTNDSSCWALVRRSEYLLTTLEDVLEKVQGKTLFVGDGLGIYRKEIEAAYKKYSSKKASICKCLFADEKWWYPQGKVMASLAYQRFRNQQYDDAAKLLPLYLYPQDCQVTKN